MIAPAGFSLRAAEEGDANFRHALFISSRERELAPLPDDMRSQFGEFQYRVHKQGLERDFPDARDLIVLMAGEPVGMLILDERPQTLLLVDIAIVPASRNQGSAAVC